jgi:hypothetical protein
MTARRATPGRFFDIIAPPVFLGSPLRARPADGCSPLSVVFSLHYSFHDIHLCGRKRADPLEAPQPGAGSQTAIDSFGSPPRGLASLQVSPATWWAWWRRTEKRMGVTTGVLRITGTVTGGQGLAAINYARIIDAASAHCPEIANCGRFGTINVRLDQPFDKSRADIWTPKVSWRPVVRLDEDVVEEYGFVSVKLEYPIRGALHEAWVVFPSAHAATYLDRYLVEIIAAELISGQRLRSESLCAVSLDHGPALPRPSSFGDNWKPLLQAPSLW